MRTLKQSKQTMKEIDQYPYRREMNTDELMGRAINRLRFKSNIWMKQMTASYDEIYQMVNDIRFLSGKDPMSRKMFLDGMQYRDIFADNYYYALSELKALCWGDWQKYKMTIREFLDELDGCGIIITDYDLIENYLKWFDATLESSIEINGEEL